MGKQKAPPAEQAMTVRESALDRIRKQGVDALEDTTLVKELTFDEILANIPQDQLFTGDELGDGFHLLKGADEKKKLCGVPLIVVDYRFNPGAFGQFVTMHVRTKNKIAFDGDDHDMFIVNDGGTGIPRQLADFKNQGKAGMIYLKNGLRVSEDYEVMEKYIDADTGKTEKRPIIGVDGKPILGTTFYLDTSA